jgi:hypothetical protein
MDPKVLGCHQKKDPKWIQKYWVAINRKIQNGSKSIGLPLTERSKMDPKVLGCYQQKDPKWIQKYWVAINRKIQNGSKSIGLPLTERSKMAPNPCNQLKSYLGS